MMAIPSGLCSRRATIKRPTYTSQSDGTSTTAYDVLRNGVAVEMVEASNAERERYGRDGSASFYRCYVPLDIAIRTGDRFDYGTSRMDIIGVVNPGTRDKYRVVYAEDIR